MLDDFCVFIVTHQRPHQQITLQQLRKGKYTGRIFLIVDNEDPTVDEYKQKYGDQVIVFDKAAMDAVTDKADNIEKRNSVVWARNAIWQIALDLQIANFLVLDDDYVRFEYRMDSAHMTTSIDCQNTLDFVFAAMVKFLYDTKAYSVAFAQGGDLLGGPKPDYRLKRKVMNTFFCRTDKPFAWYGRMNDDVNTYVSHGNRGKVFLTYLNFDIVQRQTQSSSGGLTNMYLEFGTYMKSFTTVMYAPSCVKVTLMGHTGRRLHHAIVNDLAYPKLLSSKHSKNQAE